MQFIDRARFVGSSLSNLGNNISEEIHKIKCKYRYDNKKCENCGIKFEICDCFLKYTNFIVAKRCLPLWIYEWLEKVNETSLP